MREFRWIMLLLRFFQYIHVYLFSLLTFSGDIHKLESMKLKLFSILIPIPDASQINKSRFFILELKLFILQILNLPVNYTA